MFHKFSQQEPQVKIALIIGISLIICTLCYSLINATLRKTDTTRCVEAYLEVNEYDSKLDAYQKCRYLLKR